MDDPHRPHRQASLQLGRQQGTDMRRCQPAQRVPTQPGTLCSRNVDRYDEIVAGHSRGATTWPIQCEA
jgi:hypothetical protein